MQLLQLSLLHCQHLVADSELLLVFGESRSAVGFTCFYAMLGLQSYQQIALEEVGELLVFLQRNLRQEFALMNSIGNAFADNLMCLTEGQSLAYQIVCQVGGIGIKI